MRIHPSMAGAKAWDSSTIILRFDDWFRSFTLFRFVLLWFIRSFHRIFIFHNNCSVSFSHSCTSFTRTCGQTYVIFNMICGGCIFSHHFNLRRIVNNKFSKFYIYKLRLFGHFQWTMRLFDIETNIKTKIGMTRGSLDTQLTDWPGLGWVVFSRKFGGCDSFQMFGAHKWFQCNTRHIP